MKIDFHSPDNLFTAKLKARCTEKFARPIERYKLDGELTRVDVVAVEQHESIGFRVRFRHPGMRIHVSAIEGELLNACDKAIAKLDRKLKGLIDKKADAKRRAAAAWPEPQPLGESDLFTEDEEEVLRDMGALDTVLAL
jgi:ribosome-associated translation inhibitor RaiA